MRLFFYHCVQIHWSLYVYPPRPKEAALLIITSFTSVASAGLFVIGGDVTNLVGLGGCKPEGT